MANPLYQAVGKEQMNPVFQRIMQFGQRFQGDPKTEAMKLINSGRFSQQELDQYQALARQMAQTVGAFRR